MKKYLTKFMCYLFGHNPDVYSDEMVQALYTKAKCRRCSKDLVWRGSKYDV